MSIRIDSENGTLTLHTAHTAYQMQIGRGGHLLHVYYGPDAEGTFARSIVPADHGFSMNPYEIREGRSYSVDQLPLEYPGSNIGDFRTAAVDLITDNGICGCDLRVRSYAVEKRAYTLQGLPAARDPETEAETLHVVLGDEATGLEAELLYGVFFEKDVITRAVRLKNTGDHALTLLAAASMCLDLPERYTERIHFHGRHTMEMQTERCVLAHGIQTISSGRGMSSHHHNPFTILCEEKTTEEQGWCIGVMPVYSGNHRTDIEVDQKESVRVVTGINRDVFTWRLEPGEVFETPQVLLTFCSSGLEGLSRQLHRFFRKHILRWPEAWKTPPVLLNSWEAVYMDFDAKRICALAKQGARLSSDLFVLDDGWFAGRSSDTKALGDWTADKTKFPHGLVTVEEDVRKQGVSFGIWIEPEMVSEDSELFRKHPDYALRVPGRKPVMGRDQLVLDLSRQEVVDGLYDQIARLLEDGGIRYVKWDANRSVADLYSAALPPERQRELSHRYVLGLYSLMERLTAAFPQVLFEGCAGGGGRFDAGILYYFPQIWGSDDTDAVARLSIQRGYSFGYPPECVGSHISDVPNEQTGRTVPLSLRALTAMSGTFGLELDPARLSEQETEELQRYIGIFRRYAGLIRTGIYSRLRPERERDSLFVWEIRAEDASEVLVFAADIDPQANAKAVTLYLRGLQEQAVYRLTCVEPETVRSGSRPLSGQLFTGSELMQGAFSIRPFSGTAPAALFYFERTECV